LLIIFYVFSIYSALKNHRKETTFIEYQYDNQSLLHNLQNEQTEAARLNQELELDLAKLRLAEEQLKQEKDKAEELAEKLLAISSQDGLTGIANRRHFDDFLAKEWNRAVRSRKPLSLVLCDIDHFKAFNDFYGHQEGDKCLLRIAHTLDMYARRSGDLAARYGGEEFAIILPETSLGNATDIADQIHNAVLEIAIPHAASETDNIVTVSFGVATVVPRRSQQSRMLVALADKALYEAKQKGRNRVVSSTPELVESTKLEKRS
jgi:diguanylate cyclase (GGDEF)-like protein